MQRQNISFMLWWDHMGPIALDICVLLLLYFPAWRLKNSKTGTSEKTSKRIYESSRSTIFGSLQVMSKSCACKFLYGADTASEEKGKIEDALDSQTELKTDVLFYRKNGKSPAWTIRDQICFCHRRNSCDKSSFNWSKCLVFCAW